MDLLWNQTQKTCRNISGSYYKRRSRSTTGGESKPQTKPFLGKLYPLYSLPCGTRNLWHCTILCIYFCNSNYCNDQLQRQFRRNIQQSWTNVLKHPAHAPCVVIIYVVPFQIFNALYPVFISIGAGFGIPAVAIIAPFVCNLSLATSSTPTNSSTYTGCALTETDVQRYCKKAVPIQTVTNAIVVLTAVLFHVLKL